MGQRHPGKMEIGYRRNDGCVTWKLYQGYASNEFIRDQLEKFCRVSFLRGARFPFYNGGGIEGGKIWFDKKKGGRIWGFGQYFFRAISGKDCEYAFWRGGWECKLRMETFVHDRDYEWYRYFDPLFSDDYSSDGSEWLTNAYPGGSYVDKFRYSGWRWFCQTYTLDQSGRYSDSTLHFCDNVRTAKDHYVACRHDFYRNCEYKKQEHCHYDNTDEKWYKYIVVILDQADSPYGKPCPTVLPEDWKNQCERKCRGQWGEWSAQPSEEHLRCDTITVERFAPAQPNDDPCYKDSPTCCMAKKLIKYNDSCTDFAFNTTINLRKSGCNNNGTFATDSHGHLMCMCPDRYKGVQCEEDVCEGKCKNDGTCIPGRGEAHCFCRRGFTGSNCTEALKACGESGTCENGGTCETLIMGVETVKVCKCKDGYGGVRCEHAVEKCEDDSCNHNGACTEDIEYGSIVCRCYQDYEGERCEKKDGKILQRAIAPTASNVINLVVGLVLGFLMLTFCFGGAAVHHRRRRRRRGGHSYESSYASSFSTAISSRASTFSTAISKAFGRQSTVKSKKGDTRSLGKTSSKAVGVSKIG
ncbi:hypothetical protein M513_01471 [Trichuris suis]|uniref:EGF-like domain-containing protein n=1 Tax=Trichuris suis TaxID=68888 RepID=A0A085MKQ5_9BILA|nr:hypothetical protein M513_01471 [Trichuris suis]